MVTSKGSLESELAGQILVEYDDSVKKKKNNALVMLLVRELV